MTTWYRSWSGRLLERLLLGVSECDLDWSSVKSRTVSGGALVILEVLLGAGLDWSSVKSSTWSDNLLGGVVVYGTRTLRAHNGSIPSEMASNLSIRAIYDYSDEVFPICPKSLRRSLAINNFLILLRLWFPFFPTFEDTFWTTTPDVAVAIG